jgi:Lamin Tail Domain
MNAQTPSIPRRLTVTTALAISLGLGLGACPSDDPAGNGTGDTSGNPTGTGPTTETDSGTDTDTGPMGDCGNDMVEQGEECDGAELDGKTCPDIDPGYIGGTLACGATCTFDASACMLSPDAALVTLNEITSESVMAGMTSGPNDAIEIYNGGAVAADISGWKLSDDATFPDLKTYVFPEGTTIDGGEFLVLLSIDMLAMTGELPFGVSDTNEETISLADASGAVVDEVLVDGYKARVSYCRLPDASGPWFQCEQTFGAVNQLATTACGNGTIEDLEECDSEDIAGATCEGLGLGYSGGTVVCSPKCNLDADGCTTNSDTVLNEINATSDDIEIFNGSNVEVDLSGWVLTDDKVEADYDVALDLAELVFPPGTTLAPGEYLVVAVGLGVGQHPFGLGLMSDTITLADPAGPTIIDQVHYSNGDATTSYCRQPNGPGGAWMANCTPSMGVAN